MIAFFAQAQQHMDGLNVNSAIITVATGLIVLAISWVGRKSSDNNDKLTVLSTELPHLQQAIGRVETQMANTVTRPELDSKLAEIKVEQARLEVEIVKINQRQSEIELAAHQAQKKGRARA